MTPTTHGIGLPTSYAGQTFAAGSPYAGNAMASTPFGLQAQQYFQPQQHQLQQQLLHILPQQLQQLLHIVPQQLHQLQTVQQQIHHFQQLLQIVPQQLQQFQQLLQNVLPQLSVQQPFHFTPQPFTSPIHSFYPSAFWGGLSQQAVNPWGFSGTGHGVQPFGYGGPPNQLM
jgi:hypothetical protein